MWTYDDGLEALPGLGAFDAPVTINGEAGVTRQELIADPQQPISEMEALMATIPHNEVMSVLEQKRFAEGVSDCMDFLIPEVVETLDAIGGERITEHDLAARLGVSQPTAHRRKYEAFARLREVASCHPAVVSRLGLDDRSFETAARVAAWKVLTGEGVIPPEEARLVEGDGVDWEECNWIAGRIARGAAAKLGEANPYDVAELVSRKQHDYGHGNILAFGAMGIVVRLSDKVARYQNLVGMHEKPSNESIEDTLLDMIGYAVLTQMSCDGTFLRKLSEKYEEPQLDAYGEIADGLEMAS